MDEIDMSQIKGITQDSRKVEPGYLFAALPGTQVDGRDFIAQAIEAGATHILTTPQTQIANDDVRVIEDDNPQLKLAQIAAQFYAKQPEHTVAITGTNGKTSVAHFTRQLFERAGHKAASLGTLGIEGADIAVAGSMTTPDPVALHQGLAQMVEQGVTHLAMEASSHGLAQYRLDGVSLKAAAFTNLSQDHLDYHGTMDDYFAAKKRLFTDLLKGGGAAILNADDARYDDLCGALDTVISYGYHGEHLKIIDIQNDHDGQTLSLEIFGKNHTIKLPLIGLFQAYNALCALGLVLALDKNSDPAHLESLTNVPGRLQSIQGHPEGAGVFVDYAHTPDALINVLETLRPHAAARLICIAGCGGDRDKTKRPLMGKAASGLSDHVIITDDNPRSEEPEEIRAQMIAGITKDNYEDIGDRAQAIHAGISNLKSGDILLIAGKGHEQGQQVGDEIYPFDDAQQAQKNIQNLLSENKKG